MIEDDNMAEELPEIDPSTLKPIDPVTLQPIDADDDAPELQPAPVSDEPVALLSDDEMDSAPDNMSKIRGFNQGGISATAETEFKRPLLNDGHGATRCKIFHCKIGPGPVAHLEQQINEWLDNSDAEVKFVSKVVGVMEGKRSEANLFVTLWY